MGALLFLGGVACFLALTGRTFRQDEAGQLGYTMSLRDGRLPSVGDAIPAKGGGPELEVALKRPVRFARVIQVANNPPFPYLVGLPLAEASSWLGMDGGGLFGLRVLDVGGAVVAVACVYLLGRELSGGDRFVGLVAAGLVAGTISIAVVTAIAAIDGPALAATTGTTWALARFARTRTLTAATDLGIWCAVAAAIRPMAAVYALAAAALGVLLGLQAHRLRALPSLAIRLGGPALLLTGWFYALNVYRYGEPTGAGGGPAGNASPSVHFLDALTGRLSFVGPLHYLVTEVYDRSAFWVSSGVREYSVTAVALLLIAAAIGLSVQSARSARARAAEPELVPAAWLSVTILGAVPTLLIAQHMSAGGGAHPRYLMPVLPILAVAAALVVSRINRWFAVLAVAGFALAELTRVRAAGDLARFGTPTPPTLGGQPFIALSVVVALVGAAVLVLALAVMAASAPEP